MHDEHFETGIMIEMSVAGGDDQAMMFVLKLGQFLGDAVRLMIVDETTMASGEAVCSPTSRSRIRSRKGNLFGFKIGLGHYEPIITCRKSGNDKGALASVCVVLSAVPSALQSCTAAPAITAPDASATDPDN